MVGWLHSTRVEEMSKNYTLNECRGCQNLHSRRVEKIANPHVNSKVNLISLALEYLKEGRDQEAILVLEAEVLNLFHSVRV